MPHCYEAEFVFARGSGQPHETGGDWNKFKEAVYSLVRTVHLNDYSIMDLDYPAITVKDPKIAIGAYISSGQYFEFGQSVLKGQRTLRDYYLRRSAVCPDEIWVLAGYSQGAIVETGVLKYFNPDKVAYIGLFGDPELSLPEGKGGWRSDACKGKNWSPYRVNVPNCKTYKGSLGQRDPYEYGPFQGKYGLWCNDRDFICGSSKTILNTDGHTEYRENGSYFWMMSLVEPHIKEMLDKQKDVSGAQKSSIKLTNYYIDSFPVVCSNEYYAAVGEAVEISDTCGSTITDNLYFAWSVDGGAFERGDSMKVVSFDAAGDHIVKLRAGRNEYNYADSVAMVHVGDNFDEEMAPPNNIVITNNGDTLRLSWDNAPSEAKYLLVARNGFNLGLAPVEDGYVDVGDLGELGEDVLNLTWVDESYTIGEWSAYRMSDGELINSYSEEPKPVFEESLIENVNTGDSIKNLIIVAIVVFGLLVIIAAINKNAHRER